MLRAIRVCKPCQALRARRGFLLRRVFRQPMRSVGSWFPGSRWTTPIWAATTSIGRPSRTTGTSVLPAVKVAHTRRVAPAISTATWLVAACSSIRSRRSVPMVCRVSGRRLSAVGLWPMSQLLVHHATSRRWPTRVLRIRSRWVGVRPRWMRMAVT